MLSGLAALVAAAFTGAAVYINVAGQLHAGRSLLGVLATITFVRAALERFSPNA